MQQTVEAHYPKKVGILTNFNSYDRTYSLIIVCEDQLKMLLNNGYQPTLIVAEGFDTKGEEVSKTAFADPRVIIKKISNVAVSNDVQKDPTFDADVEKLENELKVILKDLDVVITHDLIYQPDHLKHNIACRRIAKDLPNLLWYHWIHSATAPSLLNQMRGIFQEEYLQVMGQAFPNSFPVFFNHYSIPRIAKNFGYNIKDVRVVHHPTDYCSFFDFHPIVRKLVNEKDLLSADAIAVYPIRLDRGKQVEVVVKTMACLKQLGDDVRVIIGDFHSTGGDKVTYREDLKHIGIEWGLNPQELIFLSEFDESLKLSTPRKAIGNLFQLSNVFIQPCVSESYSLITQEAIMSGVVLVLNDDFPPFRDIFGPNAIFRKYSADIDIMNGLNGRTTTVYDQGEKMYHMETASMIHYQLHNNPVIDTQRRIRKTRNLQYVFEHELQPLFYGNENK